MRERLAGTPEPAPRSTPAAGRRRTRAPQRCSTASPAAPSSCAKGCGSSPGRPRCRSAGGARGRRKARSTGSELLARFVLGYDVVGRLAGRLHAAPAGAPERPGLAARRRGHRGAAARPRRGGVSRAMRIATTLLLTPSYTNAVAGATTLNVAGGMSGYAGALAPELALAGFGRSPTRSRRRSGSSSAPALRPTACSTSSGRVGDHAQLFPPLCLLQPDPPGARLPRRRARPSCARTRRRSPASTSRPIASRRSCATQTRRITSPRNTRCRMPPRRWSCAAAPGCRARRQRLADPVIAALRHRCISREDPAMTARRRACARRG